jgi:hypothetical protein
LFGDFVKAFLFHPTCLLLRFVSSTSFCQTKQLSIILCFSISNEN